MQGFNELAHSQISQILVIHYFFLPEKEIMNN